MRNISIAIVDNETLVVSLLSEYLHNQEGIEVSFTANSGEQFLTKLSTQVELPDVLLIDLKMKEINGAKVTEILKCQYPEIQTIVMSSYYKKSFMGFML